MSEKIDRIIGERIRSAPQAQAPAADDVLDNLLRAMDALERSKRTVVCNTGSAAMLADEVRRRGLEGLIEVLGSPHVDPGVAYVMPRGTYNPEAAVNFRPPPPATCACGNSFDGDNLCMPSACEQEV